jgi:hypothetical protein
MATWPTNWIEQIRADKLASRREEIRRRNRARYLEQRKAEREAEAKQRAAGKTDAP